MRATEVSLSTRLMNQSRIKIGIQGPGAAWFFQCKNSGRHTSEVNEVFDGNDFDMYIVPRPLDRGNQHKIECVYTTDCCQVL
ncbi:hypothetical protein P343_01420 [Sporolactobacillus laevolacticus DSM 442]|uniref:Uncharacterized protein n=1 Tax=Sporolactobacillus laevolacticus DSM 442 TaxID=1395513 RepID=V6J1I6_9BACL|nr:hypothetical protein P343_01420 [Sporolactobacillus laevolacticus DSM 442]